MAKLRIKAIAPPIDPPIQWGSNIFVVGQSADFEDQSSPPDLGVWNYSFREYDFTKDTMPPFKPNIGKEFHSIKITDKQLYAPDRDSLTLDGQEVQVGDIITNQDLKNLKFKFRAYGPGISSSGSVGKFSVMYSEDGINYPTETDTQIRIISTRREILRKMNFENLATIHIDAPVKPITISDISQAFLYSTQHQGGYESSIEEMLMYINTVGQNEPYKILFSSLDGCKAIRHFGETVVAGQRIQHEAFNMGQVKVYRELLDRPYNIEILFGEAYTGKFRLEPYNR